MHPIAKAVEVTAGSSPGSSRLEQQIRIPMPEGEADAYILTPPNATPGVAFPGVIDLPDIKGIRDATLASSRRLAAEGYIVLAPNVFYRTGRPPVVDFPMNFAEERTQRRFAELTGPLTPAAMHADAQSYVAALDKAGASPGPVRHPWTLLYRRPRRFAPRAALPDRIAAVASFHGGHLFNENDSSSPYRELPGVRASLYFGHASNDTLMPAEAIEKFEKALADWGHPLRERNLSRTPWLGPSPTAPLTIPSRPSAPSASSSHSSAPAFTRNKQAHHPTADSGVYSAWASDS